MSRVAVVGAGVMGLAAAHALAREGHDVVVHERFRVGHDRGSSHGRTRIFRLAYADPAWVRLAQEALRGWRELEAEAGEELLVLDGLVEIVTALEESSAPALDACGVAWERLTGEEAERRYPVRVPPGSFAVLQPEAGIVRADRALAAFARGLDVREGSSVRSPDELDADAVVVTAGGWVNELVDPPLPVRVTRETICYFRLDGPVPAVVSFKADSHGHDFYALADPVHGLKVGAHHAGPETDANETAEPSPELVARISAWANEVFRLADPEPVAADTCIYTTTADESFVLERRGRVVVGSACSGHGFKFAPAIGARLAALAAG
ncbi:MAG: FAD-dependent oxidoreductase [Gaiellaceae bacterium]